MESLVRISELPVMSMNMDDLYLRSARILSSAISADLAALYMMSSSKKECTLCGLSNVNSLFYTKPLPYNTGRLESLIERRKILVYGNNIPNPQDIALSNFGVEQYHMGISIPIVISTKTVGFFALLFEDCYKFCPEDTRYLLLLGETLGIAIQCCQMLQQLTDQVAETNANALAEIQRDINYLLKFLTFRQDQNFSENVPPESISGFRKNEEGPYIVETLTARDIEVLQLVAKGYSNIEIGNILFISEGTVKKRVGSILRKLGFSNRVQAVAYAFRQGYLQ